jgi:hypothetical protein
MLADVGEDHPVLGAELLRDLREERASWVQPIVRGPRAEEPADPVELAAAGLDAGLDPRAGSRRDGLGGERHRALAGCRRTTRRVRWACHGSVHLSLSEAF